MHDVQALRKIRIISLAELREHPELARLLVLH